MESELLVISSRFCGPPKSGNGGYVCGRVAAHVPGSASVRLKAPPPLETELRIEASESEARLMQGSNVIAEAKAAALDLTPPAAPGFVEAEDAAKSYTGFTRHVFPRCFVCGPQRASGDGLRIFPGSTTSQSMVAAPWIPDPSLAKDSNVVRSEFSGLLSIAQARLRYCRYRKARPSCSASFALESTAASHRVKSASSSDGHCKSMGGSALPDRRSFQVRAVR